MMTAWEMATPPNAAITTIETPVACGEDEVHVIRLFVRETPDLNSCDFLLSCTGPLDYRDPLFRYSFI
jgi:hypothetical protein